MRERRAIIGGGLARQDHHCAGVEFGIVATNASSWTQCAEHVHELAFVATMRRSDMRCLARIGLHPRAQSRYTSASSTTKGGATCLMSSPTADHIARLAGPPLN